ncbi:MAG TPA: putative quinol monooxygenase [Rhizomicrobium sp.]|nr:putative quinol monooxygenase [Rhizomicrobium sp.]
MPIGLVVTIEVSPGQNDAFESIVRELMNAVRTNEPGNIFYQFCKSRTEENVYVVMECYKDEAARESHMNSGHMKAFGPKLRPLMRSPSRVQYFDAV